jgi:hypothetical protein
LAFILKGGDIQKLDKSEILYLLKSGEESEKSQDPYRTPEVVNLFDQLSEFQASSAGIVDFKADEDHGEI